MMLAILISWCVVNTVGLVLSILLTRTMGVVVTNETDAKLDKLVNQTFGVERE